MHKTIAVLFIIMLVGCSNPETSAIELDVGQAIVTIGNIEYEAEAIVDSQYLLDTEYEEISLIISDSVSIVILKVNFLEETITWTGESLNPDGVIFFLRHGSLYGPHDGSLVINDKTDSTISGKFNLNLIDGNSSISYRPENRVNIEGQFIARKN